MAFVTKLPGRASDLPLEFSLEECREYCGGSDYSMKAQISRSGKAAINNMGQERTK